jgi:hypothetical protein
MESLFYRRAFIKTVTSGLVGLKLFLGSKLGIFAASPAENAGWVAYLRAILPYYDKWEFEQTAKKLGTAYDAAAFKKIAEELDGIAKKLFKTTFSELKDPGQQSQVIKEGDKIDPERHVGFRNSVLLSHCTRRNGFRFLGYDEDTKSELFICDLQFETYTEPMYKAEEISAGEMQALIPDKMREKLREDRAIREAWDVSYPEEKLL